MLRQPGQDVARVLPHRLGHHQRHRRIDLPERFDAVDLAVEEAVLLHRVVGVPSHDGGVQRREGARHRGLEGLLGGPAHPVGGQP